MTARFPSGDQRATASSHAKQEFMPMGCMSLSVAVEEVGEHLFGDDWIGDELSAGALNIRARRDRDRDIATAKKERQSALFEEQEGRMAMLERAFSVDPEPLPELSKDDQADVETALAKKWEGEEEAHKRARKRLESATAWLGRRLYGTPRDYGDAVPSYIPSWYGKLWRLSVGFWHSHSVQEVLFTEVEYHPVDYGEAFPEGADPLKGSVLIWQEGLREAITRDRAINQTDSGIDPSRMAQEIKADTKKRLGPIEIARMIERREKEAGNEIAGGGKAAELPEPADPKSSAFRPNRAGRKIGSGSYDSKDAPLLEEIHALVENEEPMGLWNAALTVVDRAHGKGNTESRAKRLVKKYKEKYGLR